jgi:ribosome-associated protein
VTAPSLRALRSEAIPADGQGETASQQPLTVISFPTEEILEILELAHSIVDAIAEKQGEDISLLDIRKLSPLVDYFVVCSGTSERQIKAIVDGIIEHTLKQHTLRPRRIEGAAESGWVLIDFIDIVVHIFSNSQRKYYRLEDVWKEAPIVLRMQ